ncbi:MAG: cytochrome c [Pyrinomonadaceae bacterium]|nr:cytochrome c [Pyrinomonadaceae bacterium]
MKTTLTWFGYILLPVVVLGGMMIFFRDVTKRNREYPIQMGVSPAYRSQTVNESFPNGLTTQLPVAGTIARGFKPFHYDATPEEAKRAGAELTNPFNDSAENLERGKYIFTKSCAVCHGPTGAGDGPVIPKFPNPPSFKTETSRALADGELFHVITRGRNNMPAAEANVSTEDRWKLVLYIRTLQAQE